MTALGSFLITYSFFYLFVGLCMLLQLKKEVFRDEIFFVVVFWPIIFLVYLFVTIAPGIDDAEEGN